MIFFHTVHAGTTDFFTLYFAELNIFFPLSSELGILLLDGDSDGFGLQVLLDAVRTQLATLAGLFEAPKRSLGRNLRGITSIVEYVRN